MRVCVRVCIKTIGIHSQFWRLRSPTICRLQSGDPERPARPVSPSTKPCEQAERWCKSQSGGEDEGKQLRLRGKQEWKGRIPPASAFCAVRHLGGLDDAPQHWGGQSALGSPLIRCWSHAETPSLTRPGRIFNPGIPGPVKLTYKINHVTASLYLDVVTKKKIKLHLWFAS